MSDCSESPPDPSSSNVERLLAAGFRRTGAWRLVSGAFRLPGLDTLPREPGVYAYAIDGKIHYVGSAQRGLRARLRHYEIAKTLRTVHRVRQEIMNLLAAGHEVEVFTFVPKRLYWRGLPVDMVAGLEEGLIRELRPVWNVRGLGGVL